MMVDNLNLPPEGNIEHLLWALMFLKSYGKEKVMSALAGGVDPQTFRKWVWIFIEAISYLEDEVVSLEGLLLVDC